MPCTVHFTFHKDSEETVATPEPGTLGGLSDDSALFRSPFSIHSNLCSVSDHHSDSSLFTTTVHQRTSQLGGLGGGMSLTWNPVSLSLSASICSDLMVPLVLLIPDTWTS